MSTIASKFGTMCVNARISNAANTSQLVQNRLLASFSNQDRVTYRTHNDASSELERRKTISAYYNIPAVDTVSKKHSVRLTPSMILYTGKDSEHVIKSAQYLQSELPIRIAQRIMDFRNLPFIVGCNPNILGVHELYIRAFNILHNYDEIQTAEQERQFSVKLQELLEDHKDVTSRLAEGFRECQRHIKDEPLVAKFLDTTLTSRLSIRMLAQHHLTLRANKPNYVGIINTAMSLKEVVDRNSKFVSRMALYKYNRVPKIKLSGHVDAKFPYIELPLEYILPELLKNAVRATIEGHSSDEELPPIHITVANNPVDFIIKISDRGKGVPHHLVDKILEYNFTTAGEEKEEDEDEDVMANIMESANASPVGGPMHGFGFGLPTSQAYARYMGGGLKVMSMQGIGTDVFIRLRHINTEAEETFRL